MSQMTTNTETIGKHTYTVGRLDPFVANDILVDIFKVLGPTIGALGGVAADSKMDGVSAVLDGVDLESTEEDPKLGEKLAGAFDRLAKALDKKALRDIMTAFAQVTTVDYGDGRAPRLGAGAAFTTHFRENYEELYPWLAFCFKHQYSAFSKPVGKLIAAAGRVIKKRTGEALQ